MFDYVQFVGKCLVAALAILLAGCGGSSQTDGRAAVTYASNKEILDALSKAGMSCTGYENRQGDNYIIFTEGAVDVGDCKVDNESVTLIVWKDNGQRDNYAGMIKSIGCEAKVFGRTTFDYVAGERWTIDGPSQTLAKKMSEAVGGKPEHIVCSN